MSRLGLGNKATWVLGKDFGFIKSFHNSTLQMPVNAIAANTLKRKTTACVSSFSSYFG